MLRKKNPLPPITRRVRSRSSSHSRSPEQRFSPHSPVEPRKQKEHRNPRTRKLLNQIVNTKKQAVENKMSNRTRKLRGAINEATNAIKEYDKEIDVNIPINYAVGQYSDIAPEDEYEAAEMDLINKTFIEKEKQREQEFENTVQENLELAINSVKGNIKKQVQVLKIVELIKKLFHVSKELYTEIEILQENAARKRVQLYELGSYNSEIEFEIEHMKTYSRNVYEKRNEIKKNKEKMEKISKQIEQLEDKIAVAEKELNKVYLSYQRQQDKLDKITKRDSSSDDIIGLGKDFGDE